MFIKYILKIRLKLIQKFYQVKHLLTFLWNDRGFQEVKSLEKFQVRKKQAPLALKLKRLIWFEITKKTRFYGMSCELFAEKLGIKFFIRDARWIKFALDFCSHLSRSKAAWQILTPQDTLTWVLDQMILPPVKFFRLTQLTF